MPERPLTVAAYAAGASLAAVTLVYVFGPTFFFDDEAANSSSSSRKKGVVGLINSANDCFINSVLQALAGLPELRRYLIREVHRRSLDGPETYKDLTAASEEQEKNKNSKKLPEWKLLGLQQGIVTAGLKSILDALNERPLNRKIISPAPFIRVVEEAFRIRMSRAQQDAHELLQIVLERLNDENHAARGVRKRARRRQNVDEEPEDTTSGEKSEAAEAVVASTPALLQVDSSSSANPRDSKLEPLENAVDIAVPNADADDNTNAEDKDENEDELVTFPFEGKIESQVECSHCRFKPRPSISTFVNLTLHVPQNAGSLNSCFDGIFKQEQIDDFTCDRCRLEHALQVNAKQASKPSLSQEEREALEMDRDKIEEALREDPEKPPKDVKLPDLSTAPKRRISRHMRMSTFPRVLSLHLSRSVWESGSSSSKNTSKVSFPETLYLGGLLDRKTYRLLAVVTHKGGHNSGHYETFRRQFLSAPYSTAASMGTGGIYGVRSSPAPSPKVSAEMSPRLPDLSVSPSASPSPSSSSQLTPTSSLDRRKLPPTSIPLEAMPTPGLPTPPQSRHADTGPKQDSSLASIANRAKRKKGPDRWWRISDEKIKECKTSDVLGMQREVYLLFYELVEDDQA